MYNGTIKNTPLEINKNTQLDKELQKLGHRRYTTAHRIEEVAKYYYQKNRKGITISHVIREGIAKNKPQAQNTLKRFRKRGILFTIENRRPQRYYPSSLKSEILEHYNSKNLPTDPTGIKRLSRSLSNQSDELIYQTLEGYVLPLLPDVPLDMHNIHLKFHIKSEYYDDLTLSTYKRNYGKYHNQRIGNYLVRFTMYRNGTVEIDISSSNKPFRIMTEIDLARLIVFFGEVRAYVKDILNDPHERVVPDIMNWEMTECDLNKDVRVGDGFHWTGLKIQLRHFHHLFRVYFKTRGRDTVCRLEKSLTPHKPAIKVIDEIFNFNTE